MATVQQIITYADRKFPNQDSSANKILDLDDIHKAIYVELARLKNDIEIVDGGTTVAGQLTYPLPANCTIDNIVSIKVSQSATITASTEWYTHEYAGLNDDISSGTFYIRANSTEIGLIKDGEYIATSGLQIMFYYYKTPAAITLVTDTPELDSDYHDLLKFGLIQTLASQGHNPDTEIADYYQKKYDEFMQNVVDSLSDRYNKAPSQNSQVIEYW